jgi:hypothetical protein
MSTLTVNGGTLVVCSDLTIDKFYMDSGVIFIRPGARFVIGSGIGAGIIFRGKSAIYNYGTCEVQRNLSLENGYATASKPNLVINATGSSVFKMSNQYFVINNPFSWFVNQGKAEFWGIITDPMSVPGSVCLGHNSTTRMAVLINKVANAYTAPEGNACVNVFQFSEFYGRLSNTPTLFACLGAGHSSNASCIPWGCQPNNWGSAQVFTSCVACGTIAALAVQFSSFTVAPSKNRVNTLAWQMQSGVNGGQFTIMRSPDGEKYAAIDSLKPESGSTLFNLIDKNPLQGNNFYMIRYTHPGNGTAINSKMVKVVTESIAGMNLYPVPFDNKFFVNYTQGLRPVKMILTDMTGRDIRTRIIVHEETQFIEVTVLDKIQSGIYMVHLLTDKTIIAKTIFKR